MKVAVIGANGQLGRDVCASFKLKGDVIFELNHDMIEISDMNSVRLRLQEINPDFIINTAAMHHVERCEKDPQRSFQVNGIGARNLAIVSRDIKAALVHMSTDYVFNGLRRCPYVESDLPSPINVYGNTKLSGEYFIRSITDKYFILRTSGLYGRNPCRAKSAPNFVELMLRLAKERDEVRVVNDEILTPTSTVELAKQIVQLSRTDAYGLFHATAEGSCSWYEFAKEIFSIKNIKVHLRIANPDEFSGKVQRPKYSVLENARLKKHKLNMFNTWQKGLRDYLDAG